MSKLNISKVISTKSNMTMSKGAVVCDEIKLSALMKLAQISEQKQIETDREEESIKAEKEIESATRIKEKKTENEEHSEVSDSEAVAAHKLQLRSLEKMRLMQLQERMEGLESSLMKQKATVDYRVAQLRAHNEQLKESLLARAQQREQERKEEEERYKLELKDLETLEKNRTSLVLQLQAKKHQEQAKKIEKMIEEAGRSDQLKRDEHKTKRKLLENIIVKQQRFRDVFQQISEMLWSFPHREEMVAAITPAVSAIKSLSDMMDTLVKQFKVGEVSQLDLTTAENLVEKLESGHATIKNKLDEISRSKEQEQEKEAEPTATESPAAEAPCISIPELSIPQTTVLPSTIESIQKPKVSNVSATGLEGYISMVNLEEHTRLQSHLEAHLESLKPLDSDVKLKKFRFQCQMAVNTPLNAISCVSAAHLRDKLTRLQNLLRGRPVEVGTSCVTASSHQLGIAFCMNLLAERVVVQGEQTVSSKPESAFPIAAVIVSIWAEFPVFGDLLLAHFFAQCPYLVPYYAPRTSNMTDKQYYSAQGYKYNSEDQVEPHDKFLKRLTGITTLYFAILIAKTPRDLGMTPPATLARAWGWLASLLNLDPRTDVSPTVLLTCLEVAGSTLSTVYSKQFNKLFLCIVKHYYPLIKQVSPNPVSGPISRLEIFLQKSVKSSSMSPPTGALPQHFW